MNRLLVVVLLILTGSSPAQESYYFSSSDAEKILGEKAHLSDSAETMNDTVLTYRFVYTADTTEPMTGKRGAVYGMIERFVSTALAEGVYAAIRISNQDHEGFRILPNLGNEAYFHSDGRNFHFILIRKKNVLLRMKVNKITATTSLYEFRGIARRIIERL